MSEELKPFGWDEIERWREELPRLLEQAQQNPDRKLSIVIGAMLYALQNTIAVADALKAELETEKFEHWRTGQALNTLQQEVNELHALNLYDLVGDADELRADMVATIKERDELRESLNASRKSVGMEIAKHAYTKAEFDTAVSMLSDCVRMLEIAVDGIAVPDDIRAMIVSHKKDGEP